MLYNKDKNKGGDSMNQLESIRIAGYRGRWSEIDCMIYKSKSAPYGEKVYLMESNSYGDDWHCIVMDWQCNAICETWDSLRDTIRELEDGTRDDERTLEQIYRIEIYNKP